MGKPQGINTARKLRSHRRKQKWASKKYAKAHSSTKYKLPMGGATMAKGIVLEKIGIEAKQPNSAIRKCVRAQLIKNGKKIVVKSVTKTVDQNGMTTVDQNGLKTASQSGEKTMMLMTKISIGKVEIGI